MGEATNYFYDLPDDLQFNIYKELHKIYQTKINKIIEDAFSKAYRLVKKFNLDRYLNKENLIKNLYLQNLSFKNIANFDYLI